MKILLICIGKLDRAMFQGAASEYEKRLSRFCEFEVRQLNEGPVPRNDAEITKTLESEGEKILACLKPNDYVTVMYIGGKQFTSEELAQNIASLRDGGKGRLVYIIGSSHGLCDAVVKRADFKMSMSKMTFPHQLARVMLEEQLYRAFTILNNQTYHK